MKPTIDLTIFSPLDGTIIKLEDVNDQAFAQKVMGEGVAIIPSSNKLYSPVDGVVDTLFETKHAIGINTDSGLELLIHIGQNTVSLNGKHFKTYVKPGDMVKAGELLIKFNSKAIEKAGYDLTTPITIVNSSDLTSVSSINKEKVKVSEPLIYIVK